MRRRKSRSILHQILSAPQTSQYFVLLLLSFGFVVIIWLMVFYDPCGAAIITKHLCEKYKDGEVNGHLCDKLCSEKTVYLGSCVGQNNGLKIFSFQDLWLKVPSVLGLDGGEELSPLDYPADGITMADFKSRISTYLSTKLGQVDLDLVYSLLNFADFNQNQQISLAEARSLWSLIQIHDFLMLFVFRKSPNYIPKINGTCGSLYAVNSVPNVNLYEKTDTYFQRLFPMSYLWTAPEWKYRAKVAVGFMDFVYHVYEHQGVSYNLCSINPSNLGYSKTYEFQVLDLSSLHSAKWLQRKMKNSSCKRDEDCVHTKHCATICDKLTWRCSTKLVRPNLSLACDILKDYILPNAPSSIKFDLKQQLSKCLNLDNHNAGEELRHMLLLNNLINLLFDEIENDPDYFLR